MIRKALLAFALLLAAGPAIAQLSLPPLGDTLGRVGGVVGETLEPINPLARSATRLARDRLDRLTQLVRTNRNSIELDDQKQPARRGEAVLLDPDPAALEAARAGGYALIEEAEIEGLGIAYARLAIPTNQSLATGLKRLRKLLSDKTVTSDQLHFTSGAAGRPAGRLHPAATSLQPRGGTVGIIDGGAGRSNFVRQQRGFARGAPRVSGHAVAIASLLAGAGVERIWSADVYGSDPAGGNALAIAKALGWLAGEGVPVVSISLAGPSNPLLEKAVAAARSKGTIIVAAVGNDGRAAPAAYPASYQGVVAVTGVDAKGRVLIEAGRARHLDYAAPGADLSAMGTDGKQVSLRGTSFAAPLAAARIAAHQQAGGTSSALLSAVDAEAADFGKKGPDDRYGRGVLCGACRKGI